MNQTPEISVLMPVYNAALTLKPAIWSVLNQSYTDFELLIYLDGCSDSSEIIVRSFTDPRIRILGSGENRGIVHARNELVKEAKGRFMAWLDADDLMLPGRLAFQYDYMDVHPGIDILGTWVEVRNSRHLRRVQWPTDPEILRAWSFYRNPLVQSSLMIRNKPGIQYDPEFEYLEDYRFLTTGVLSGRIALYPEFLCSYFEDPEKQRIDKYLRYDFVGKLERIMKEQFARLGMHPGLNGLSLIREFLRQNKAVHAREGRQLFQFFKEAVKKNREKKLYDPSAFDAVTAYQMLRLFKLCTKQRFRIAGYFIGHIWLLTGVFRARVRYKN